MLNERRRTATGVIPINYFGLNIQSYDYNFCAAASPGPVEACLTYRSRLRTGMSGGPISHGRPSTPNQACSTSQISIPGSRVRKARRRDDLHLRRPPAWAGAAIRTQRLGMHSSARSSPMPQVTFKIWEGYNERAPVYSLEPPQNWLACSATSTLLQNQSTLVHFISPAKPGLGGAQMLTFLNAGGGNWFDVGSISRLCRRAR